MGNDSYELVPTNSGIRAERVGGRRANSACNEGGDQCTQQESDMKCAAWGDGRRCMGE